MHEASFPYLFSSLICLCLMHARDSCSLAQTNNKWASLLHQPKLFIYFIEIAYELWDSRVRLLGLGFRIFWMHFVKHIFLSLDSKFYSNLLSLSGTVIPQSSANFIVNKKCVIKSKRELLLSICIRPVICCLWKNR